MYSKQFFPEDYIGVGNKKKLIGFAFSPSHNHFWILYDVIKKRFWSGSRGIVFTTPLRTVADLVFSYIP